MCSWTVKWWLWSVCFLLIKEKKKKPQRCSVCLLHVSTQAGARYLAFFFFFVGLSYLTFNNLIQAQGERIKLGGLMKLDKNFNSFLWSSMKVLQTFLHVAFFSECFLYVWSPMAHIGVPIELLSTLVYKYCCLSQQYLQFFQGKCPVID